MKPVYLEFSGINSFSEKTEIDFRALLSGGVFGIFGDTGSGKSTILDCIHLALYGVIERTSGSMNDCINYNVDSAYVVFDFEISTEGVRHTYRVRRERKRKNGATKAFLYEYAPDGGLAALAEGTREVNERLEAIIGLSFNDFKMCIALPQGDFAALVKAPTSERVKLVSRLFDLEKYGERLARTANEKYYRAEEEVNLVRAKMEQNEGGEIELIEQKQAELEALQVEYDAAQERLEKTAAAYDKAAALQNAKTEFDALVEKLLRYKEQLPEMQKKRAEAERIPLAKAVKRETDALERSKREKAAALQRAADAEAAEKTALLELERAKAALAEGAFDERILRASVELEKLRGAQADLEAEREAEKRLNECLEEYRRLHKQCAEEDLASLVESKEGELAALGDDETLLDHLKRNYRPILLADVYGEVRGDLRGIAEKYPETCAEIGRLLEKYASPKAGGQALDIAEIELAFKAVEQKRKQLKKELEGLNKRKQEYELNERKKELVKEQGALYRKAYETAKAKTQSIKGLGTVEQSEGRIRALRSAKQAAEQAAERAQERLNGFRAEKEKQRALYVRAEAEGQSLTESLRAALEESGFGSEKEAIELLVRLGDEGAVKAECKNFFDKYELYRNKYEETDKAQFENYDADAFERAREARRAAAAAKDELNRKLAAEKAELSRLRALREKYLAFAKELEEKEKRKKLCDELRQLLKGNRFLDFIASEYLQEICATASKTLLSLTGGRYFLRYDKEFKVGDNLDGGNVRAVKTLSGGETFLVSLSLALSLSGAICLKSLRPIEFFFLDEGFGTLDEKLVDTVMDVLGKLSKNFAVGLISHVEELKHRIETKILVTGATESSGSKVRMERF